MRLIVGFCLMCALLACAAQQTLSPMPFTVRGRVVDRATRKPIPGALISIQGSSYGAIADSLGTFILRAKGLPGAYTLVVASLGYKTERRVFKVGRTEQIALPDFRLQVVRVVIDDFVVTATAKVVCKYYRKLPRDTAGATFTLIRDSAGERWHVCRKVRD